MEFLNARRRWALAACAAMAALAFAQSSLAAPLTVEDWRSDLEFARAEMPKRHANLFHALDRSDYEAAFDRLLADLDGMAGHQIVVRLAEIVAAVGDGHSRLTLPLDPQAGFFTGHTGTAAPRTDLFHHLPLRLARAVDGYVVRAAGDAQAGLVGARLAAVDGREVGAVEAALAPVVQRDNDYQRDDLLPWFMVVPEVLHARGISASLDRTIWQFEDMSGQPLEATLAPVPLGEQTRWIELPAPQWPAGRSAGTGSRLWFADIARPDAVYVRIAEIVDQPDRTFAQFAGQLQDHLARTGKRRLIVDLRGNPGGDNSLNAPLLRALIRTPWVSEPGALFVLVDAGTFSAAMNLAEDLEQWLPAVFVGGATGARPNTYGDARKVVLPKSGLTLRLSSLYWQNHPKDGRPAIEPLIEAQATIADLRSGRDPAETVLAPLDAPGHRIAGHWRGLLSVEFRHAPIEITLPGAGDEGAGSLAIRDLGVESAEIGAMEQTGPVWRGTVALRSGPVPIAGRVGGGRVVGWIDYRGTRYPFTAILAGP
jgi:hypothetical protein